MQTLLSPQQEELLRYTRTVLGDLREALSLSSAGEDERIALADSIHQLDELFLLVVAGEFNAGKSSFINALLGADLQEVGVTPTTSHVHLLKYGAEVTAAPLEAGIWLQTAPAELLRQINIVDTPGTNAIIREHEKLTSEFIPRSDLVLFITSADRPFTESERGFLDGIRNWGKKIVLVINKIDILANPAEMQKVLEFVRNAAITLLGSEPVIFAVSARQALQSKAGEPRLWQVSGFEALEDYIFNTLDDAGRFSLKLLNPLGVGQRVITRQLEVSEQDLAALAQDTHLLDDIQRQTLVYNEDMQRNFRSRLGEIDNVLFTMQQRGNEFFDEHLRIGRIADLIRKDRIQHLYERDVIANTPQEIEQKVGELIDWLVEQDLRQWTAVADHLQKRRDYYRDRIVGEGGPREGTLAYDRQRLVDSIGMATRQAVATYDKDKESRNMADGAREAVVNTGIAGIASAAGIGLALAGGLQLAFLDMTGVSVGVVGLAIGLLVLPAKRRRSRQQLADNLAELRQKLMTGLTQQFEREMHRSTRRVEDTIAPFSRFVRAEEAKITKRHTAFVELEAHIVGLKSRLKALAG
jgi:small GTP-binding protein